MPNETLRDDLLRLLKNVPAPDQVRRLIEQNRHEAAFLRRVLKLSLDAEKASPLETSASA